ncbi:MAG: ROK family transcriptional regulator [Anaerolineales bacterium]|nr:ROK family transcriptional regulator [Anaerolineales bacterium]
MNPFPRTADQESIRKVNASIILNHLRLHSPISRAELAAMTKLNRSTVSNIVNSLLEQNLVQEMDAMDSKIGRPGIALALKPQGGAILGIEIGVGFISIILTDFVANILWRERVEIAPSEKQETILIEAEKLIEAALSMAGDQGLRALGIGLGLPGLVNTRQGVLDFAPNLGWHNVHLRTMWEQRFALPVYLENEANLAALGEYYYGVAQNVDNFIYISSGVGLGGGLIINGKLFKGRDGFAGEIGHIQRDPQGEICSCGRQGCWETQVGPKALLHRIRHAIETQPQDNPFNTNLDELTYDQIIEFAHQGNRLCRSSLEEVGKNLGAGIADLVNLFNPEMVVIGGSFSLGQEIIQPVLEKIISSDTLSSTKNNLRIAFSKHGTDACVLGAIAIVLDDILREVALV